LNKLKKEKILFFALIIIGMTILDQITKKIAVKYIVEGQQIEIIQGMFNLTLSYNKGAAFGLFANIENNAVRLLFLWGASIVALILVIYMFFYEYRQDNLGKFALSLIMGGAIGNIIDRLYLGRVVDFLDFYYRSYHWPAFNVADSSICIGVTILVLFRSWSSVKTNTNLNNDEKLRI
jgi:signal peptidase II